MIISTDKLAKKEKYDPSCNGIQARHSQRKTKVDNYPEKKSGNSSNASNFMCVNLFTMYLQCICLIGKTVTISITFKSKGHI